MIIALILVLLLGLTNQSNCEKDTKSSLLNHNIAINNLNNMVKENTESIKNLS